MLRKKEVVWIGILLVLIGVYIHFFSNWFEQQPMIIRASIRPSRKGADVFPVIFTLNAAFKLTSLKVIPLENGKFNPLIPPAWHMVSDSNSVALRMFRYGQSIKGMKAALKDVRPEALTPGIPYRILITSGKVSGFKDFQTLSTQPPTDQ